MRECVRAGRLRLWMAVVPLMVALAMGCGKEYVYFHPVASPGAAASGWVEGGEFRLPPGDSGVRLSLDVRGIIEKEKGRAEESLAITFRVDNRGTQTFILNPADAKIVDDDNRTITGARATIDKNPTGALAIPAGGRENGTLVFELPQGVRFEVIGSVRLILPYRYGDKACETTAKFIKIEDVYAYGPYYYGPYYYDPYYGPYYYPPYGYPYYSPYYYGYGGGAFIYGRHRHH